ncbi:hypothetical protein CANARDRAFT_30290, partial [[Candida] arabinofermentans NRRL YB-2248]
MSLYKQFMKYSNNFENYNFREYFIRKTKSNFKKLDELKGDNTEMIKQFQNDLAILKRQSSISQMYHFDKLVVEKLNDENTKSKD